MMKILIAVDGSEHSDRAIVAVGRMARASLQLEAILVCVSPEPLFYGRYSAATLKKVEDEQLIQQNVILNQALAQAKAAGLQVGEPVRASGVIANEIVRVAKEREVDQIAMGTRGMGAMGNLFLGSVAQWVVNQSPVPVLLVK